MQERPYYYLICWIWDGKEYDRRKLYCSESLDDVVKAYDKVRIDADHFTQAEVWHDNLFENTRLRLKNEAGEYAPDEM